MSANQSWTLINWTEPTGYIYPRQLKLNKRYVVGQKSIDYRKAIKSYANSNS